MSLVKTWSSSILPRDSEGINFWYYHKIMTAHISALFRAYLQKWNIVFDFLLFSFCSQRKITKSRNFSPASKKTLNSLRTFFAFEKKKNIIIIIIIKKKKNGKGKNKPIVSRPMSFPIWSILFCFQMAKVSPCLLSGSTAWKWMFSFLYTNANVHAI